MDVLYEYIYCLAFLACQQDCIGTQDRDRGPAGRPTVRVSPFEWVSQVSQGLLIATTTKAKRSEVSGHRLGLSRPS